MAGVVLQLPYGLVFAWGSLVPFVRADLHWPPVLIGAVFSGTPFGYGVGTIIGGRLADRTSARIICWIAVAALAIGFGTAFMFPSGLTFVVFYSALALGFGGGVALAGSVAAASQVMPRKVGAAGGALTAAYAVPVVFEAPLIAYLAPRIGWLATLRWLGLAVGVLAAVTLLVMPHLPPRRQTTEERPVSQLVLIRRQPVWTSMLLVFSTATIGSYATIELVSHAQVNGLATWVGTTALVMLGLTNVASRLLAGFASDRLGVDKVLAAVLVFVLLTSAFIVFAGRTPLGVLAAGLAAGVPVGGSPGMMSKLGEVSAPEAPHSAFGVLFASFASGSLISPLIGEPIGEPWAWVVLALPALGGLLLLRLRAGRRASSLAGAL